MGYTIHDVGMCMCMCMYNNNSSHKIIYFFHSHTCCVSVSVAVTSTIQIRQYFLLLVSLFCQTHRGTAHGVSKSTLCTRQV